MEMERNYQKKWNLQFSSRINRRFIQRFWKSLLVNFIDTHHENISVSDPATDPSNTWREI
jgi:hypothetical protein